MLLSGSATPLKPEAPDMILYGKVISADEMEGEEKVQSTTVPKKIVDSDICQKPVKEGVCAPT